jgi:hypothetical protein
MATTDALWAAWGGRGFEHLELRTDPTAVRADSLIIAVDDLGRPYRARYVVECDAGWKVARVRIEVLGRPVLAVRGRPGQVDRCDRLALRSTAASTSHLPRRSPTRCRSAAGRRPPVGPSPDVAWVVLPSWPSRWRQNTRCSSAGPGPVAVPGARFDS